MNLIRSLLCIACSTFNAYFFIAIRVELESLLKKNHRFCFVFYFCSLVDALFMHMIFRMKPSWLLLSLSEMSSIYRVLCIHCLTPWNYGYIRYHIIILNIKHLVIYLFGNAGYRSLFGHWICVMCYQSLYSCFNIMIRSFDESNILFDAFMQVAYRPAILWRVRKTFSIARQNEKQNKMWCSMFDVNGKHQCKNWMQISFS